jgi:N-acetyl-gamma-glutamyl-phosphate reductase/N-acetyl-gamma-glutamyl-phosphate/LysW-gamma-L-alpha-aminoadipyl-6-phosphate reductase
VPEVHPNLRDAAQSPGGEALGRLVFETLDVDEAARRCSVVFTATPHEVSAEVVPRLLDAGVEVVADLSPAHRLRDPGEHARCYPRVPRDDALATLAIYGLPELTRDRLAEARLIAVPGCFATAVTLAMLPLRELHGVLWDRITVDAKTGSSGSGNAVRAHGMHALRSTVVSPYAPVAHRHGPEIVQSLRDHGVTSPSRPPRLAMSAYGVNAVRGLSVSVYLFVEGEVDGANLRSAFRRTYRHEPFVRVQAGASAVIPLPDPKVVIGSNFCDVAAFADPDLGHIVLIAALDNMVKGGAGQAVQACNVRYGLPEDMGLDALPLFPA